MTTLQIGDTAPDFNGINQKGENVALSDFRGKKIVLFFYPRDNTPSCTAEACSLRDSFQELRDKNFEILGISADETQKHIKFREKYRLPFDLIADTERNIISAYGVWGPKKFMGRVFDGIHRTTFVIDENGVIERIFHKVKSSAHAEQILESYI